MTDSRDLKSGLLEERISMVRFSKGRATALDIALVPTIQKPTHSKSGHFCLDFKWFPTKWQPLCRFQMVRLLDFRSCSKSRPFANQSLFDHSKSGLVWISDPHCTGQVLMTPISDQALFRSCWYTIYLRVMMGGNPWRGIQSR